MNVDKALLQEVKAAVMQLVPGARVILYGSHARGEAGPESDYDLLIIAPESLALGKKEGLNNALYSLELEHDVVLSTLVCTLASWEDARRRVAPLRQNIDREGISL